MDADEHRQDQEAEWLAERIQQEQDDNERYEE